jgi:transcriptional regulator with XRE-family HTH domain
MKDTMQSTFGYRLQFQRRMARLTHQQVVDRLADMGIKVAKSHLSAIENDKANPTKNIIVGLATIYGVSADYLLGLSPDVEIQPNKMLTAKINELACITRNLQSIIESAQTKELA